MGTLKDHKTLRIPIGKGIRCPTILIVGGSIQFGIYNDLAHNLTEVAKTQGLPELKVENVDRLPIAKVDESKYLDVDLVVLLVDASSNESMKLVARSVNCIPATFFQGHVVMLVHKPKMIKDVCVEFERLSLLADEHTCPIFWDFISRRNKGVALNILQKLKISSGATGLPPSLFVGTSLYYTGLNI